MEFRAVFWCSSIINAGRAARDRSLNTRRAVTSMTVKTAPCLHVCVQLRERYSNQRRDRMSAATRLSVTSHSRRRQIR